MKILNCFLIFYVTLLSSNRIANAQDKGEDSHARSMRTALEVSGLNATGYPLLSKNYGPFLLKYGFTLINAKAYIPQKGDIRVFQPFPGGDPAGHIDMYDGNQWVSDFKEDNFWPSAKYKKYHPAYQIFRWLGT